VLIVLKSGSLNLLEPSGPVQACNGIALPLPLPLPYSRLYRNVVYIPVIKLAYRLYLIHCQT